MDHPAKGLEDRPSGRRRRVRLLAILGMTVLLALAGREAAPRVAYQIRIHQAERAIAGGRLDEAEGRLDLLILEKPARTWPRFLRAQVARMQGRITEAEEKLQRAIELGLPVEVARGEHELLREGGRPAVSRDEREARRR